MSHSVQRELFYSFLETIHVIIHLNSRYCCPHCWLPIGKVPADKALKLLTTIISTLISLLTKNQNYGTRLDFSSAIFQRNLGLDIDIHTAGDLGIWDFTFRWCVLSLLNLPNHCLILLCSAGSIVSELALNFCSGTEITLNWIWYIKMFTRLNVVYRPLVKTVILSCLLKHRAYIAKPVEHKIAIEHII